MKKSRLSDQQIAFILRQAEEGTTVDEVCRKAGISEATYYNWRKKYGGLMPRSDHRRCLHAALTGDRGASELPWRRCRRDARPRRR